MIEVVNFYLVYEFTVCYIVFKHIHLKKYCENYFLAFL